MQLPVSYLTCVAAGAAKVPTTINTLLSVTMRCNNSVCLRRQILRACLPSLSVVVVIATSSIRQLPAHLGCSSFLGPVVLPLCYLSCTFAALDGRAISGALWSVQESALA